MNLENIYPLIQHVSKFFQNVTFLIFSDCFSKLCSLFKQHESLKSQEHGETFAPTTLVIITAPAYCLHY